MLVMCKEERKEKKIDYIHDDHIHIEEQIETSKVGVNGEIEHFLSSNLTRRNTCQKK